MTDQLSPPRTRSTRPGTPASSATPPSGTDRPLTVSAVLAGVGSPALCLLVVWVVGLVGWFAADGGSHGRSTSVLRVGTDAWLLAHGAHLDVATPHGPATVTASPLGLTLLCLYVTYRLGRWAGGRSMREDLVGVAFATVLLAGVYGVTAFVAAFLAGVPGAEPGLGLALLGGVLVGGCAGGAGLLVGSGRGDDLRRLVPVPALAVGYAAAAAVLLVAAAGAVLAAVSLGVHGPAAARIVDQLDLDPLGGALSLLLLTVVSPNVALLGGAYLVGPGFALGTGTVVSPAEVHVGPVPTLPVLAAVPADGPAPGWTTALLLVPFLAALAAAVVAGRVLPTASWRDALLRGVAGGLAGAVLLTFATSWAGGAIGSGRMSELGAPVGPLLLWSAGSLGLGGLVGGLLATWRARRHELETTVRPARGPRGRRTPAAPSIYGAPRLSERLRDRVTGRRAGGSGPAAGPPVAEDPADEVTTRVPRPGQDDEGR